MEEKHQKHTQGEPPKYNDSLCGVGREKENGKNMAQSDHTGKVVAKHGISPQQALRDAFERDNPRLARPASEHFAAGRRKGYKNGYTQALRDVLEDIDKLTAKIKARLEEIA